MISKRIIFQGRVQGVGFRYTVMELARGFEIRGQVKNLGDGSVELIAVGEAAEVREFIDEISTESPVAHHIQQVTEEDFAEPLGLKGFRIAR